MNIAPVEVQPAPSALGDELRRRVVGQDEAITELVRCYTRYRAGLASPNRPAGIYLMIGPTGSGKSFTAKQFAKLATGSSDAPLRIDCGEFSQSHEIAKLTGSPPGFLGHRETKALLSLDRLKAQWSAADQQLNVVLFDEIDKAHPRFWDLLLGILDTGKLTLGDNTVVDFTQSIILMTGNTGSRELAEALAPSWGLGVKHHNAVRNTARPAEAAAKRMLRPEMFNRLDRVLTFAALERSALRPILELELEELRARLARRNITLALTEPVADLVCSDGFDIAYGARHLRRSLVRNLEHPLADGIISGAIPQGSAVKAQLRAGLIELVVEGA